MAAREVQPGHWVMVDTDGRPYGLIRFVRRGDQVGYRADKWPAVDGEDGELVGYFTNLKAATFAVHRNFIAKLGGASDVREYGRVR